MKVDNPLADSVKILVSEGDYLSLSGSAEAIHCSLILSGAANPILIVCMAIGSRPLLLSGEANLLVWLNWLFSGRLGTIS